MSITADHTFDDTRSAVVCDAAGCDAGMFLPFGIEHVVSRLPQLGWVVRNAFWASQTTWCPNHADRQEIGL